MFTCINNKGFQVSFNNGFEVSVMFGYGNYCANRRIENIASNGIMCENAEIMVFHHTHEFVYADGQTPYNGGWNTPEQIAKVMSIVATFEINECPKSANKKIMDSYSY